MQEFQVRHSVFHVAASAAVSLLALTVAGCGTPATMTQEEHASHVAAEPVTTPFSGAMPDVDNKAVLDALEAMNQRPVWTLTPAEARAQPTFADGVKAVLQQRGEPTTPPPGVTVRDIRVQGGAGMIPAKVYAPTQTPTGAPVIVYFHGGGWVLASPEVYDSSARALVRETGAVVVSVNYRKAPEFKFPAQHEDAFASYRWVLANARSLGGDATRVALAGESAGGNLALATAMTARDRRARMPVHVLAVYPVAGNDLNTESYQENANAKPLGRAAVAWFVHHTTRSPADVQDPRLNLVGANLRGLPPVTVVQAQIDPLRSEGALLVSRLRAAGVAVDSRQWDGTTHEFFGADAVIADAREAQAWAGERLKTAFGTKVASTR